MTLERGGMPLRISQAKREEAYEKAWSMPMSTLAKEYGITDVALKKRFKAFDMCTVKSQSTISASGFRQILHEQRDPSPYSDLPSISAVSMR